VVCLHKDRLTRFGFNYIKRCIESNGGELVVINANKTDEEDLLKDFIAIITSFCCRLYGARRGQAKALMVKTELANN
jgi:putative resolvase